MRRVALTAFALAGLIVCALANVSPANARNARRSSPQSDKDPSDWSKTYKLTGRPTLHVTTNDATIDLRATDAQEIDAHVTAHGWSIGARTGVKITESQSGNDVTIDVHVAWSSGWHIFTINNRSVRLELNVPHEADLDVQTDDGNVTADAFHGNIHFASGDGASNTDVNGLKGHIHGNIRFASGDGNIDVHGLTGQIRLHSGDGHINAEDLDGTLNADSGDGHITVRGRFDSLTLKSGDGSVNAEAISGSKLGGDWNLRTGDGSVTLRLADGFDADLDASTGDGNINLDFPVTVSGSLSHSHVHGTLGKGGPPLVIHTGDGSIHIQKF